MVHYKCTRWAVDISSWTPTLTQLAQAVAVIQPEERVRLMKFFFIDDFLSSLVGRLLMRKFISTNTNIRYENVHITRDVRGKPYLQHADGNCNNQLCFNVSHQGKYIVLAGITTDRNNEEISSKTSGEEQVGVGVDVMKIEYSGGRGLAEFFRIMQRKFSDTEWRYIRRPHHNEADQVKAFIRHWCLKEAYVKELGVGITVDLQKISFTVDRTHELEMSTTPLTGTTLCCNDKPMPEWYFEEHLLHPKYCAAIAFKNFKPELGKFENLEIEELLMATEAAKSAEVIEYCRTVLGKERKK
ncbi:L-aminoadipate-semialdehyde dehydrogenase-phosphopantetheinyl transferase [Ceratitis capitata]|uniref:L-aminoadipate-semialdehyde dehydrogenase-phosphopantetheinyl transferase n=1 Tax=Ceratitis capitata TaxID=7213 RepID=W8C648_CERCA|nr:L-aminoadipate-semialdehyde dehydrogenase-phosphopantetheinyl transferase [Ceratitis capitata]